MMEQSFLNRLIAIEKSVAENGLVSVIKLSANINVYGIFQKVV